MQKRSPLSFILALAIIIALDVSNSQTARSTNSYEVENIREFELFASSSEEINEKLLKLSTEDNEVFYPEECKQFGVHCSQETTIRVSAKTIWTIENTPPIDSKELTTKEFVEKYPDIAEPNIITNESDEKDKMIVQRVLYERGLLPVEPTGHLGHLTNIAITHLQHIKNINDEPKTIGPKTIKELNALKNRMKDDNYLTNNPLPPLEPENLPSPLKKVYEEEARNIQLIYNNPKFYKPTEVETPVNENPLPFINYVGEIKFVPQK